MRFVVAPNISMSTNDQHIKIGDLKWDENKIQKIPKQK